MPLDVIMPALGMAQDTGRLVAWLKEPGEAVAEGDALFEVETDKATMEVEAQSAGYLTGVTAEAGSDVPVGQVIAHISESPDAQAGPSAEAAEPAAYAAEADDLPDGQTVIMPTLGMAQDTGLLVSWHKAPGEAVASDDVLFEVETDKSTVEVPAGADGFLAAVLAEAGQEVPVGQTIAIISESKPDAPVIRAATAPSSAPVATDDDAPSEARPPEKADERPTPPAAVPASGDGRILASPKLRRLALEQGLDLGRLAAAGYPQPYHVRDLDTLKALPTAPSGQGQATAGAQPHQITACVAAAPSEDFLRWMQDDAGTTLPASALWAAFAAGALRAATETEADLTIDLAAPHGAARAYANPDRARLSALPDAETGAPDLILRDLTGTPITGMRLGAPTCPVVSVAQQDGTLRLTLDFMPGQFDDETAIAMLTGFAARLDDPLTHLL